MDFRSLLEHLIGNWAVGDFTTIDLIAASTNAFFAAILVTRPDHRRKWTAAGIVALAIMGGLGGIFIRDIILTDIPSPLTNPWYLVVCFLAAVLALATVHRIEPARVMQILEFMVAFSLPWYAIVGAQKSLVAGLPLLGVIFVAVLGSTSGRYLIDVTCGVTPKHFINGNWLLGSSILAALLYIILDELGVSAWSATLAAALIVFFFRYAALRYEWEKPETWDKPRD
jgi:uncharacterized membrane protein YeiH